MIRSGSGEKNVEADSIYQEHQPRDSISVLKKKFSKDQKVDLRKDTKRKKKELEKERRRKKRKKQSKKKTRHQSKPKSPKKKKNGGK